MSTAPHMSSRRRAGVHQARSIPIPKPFQWYVNWVRSNEENAQSLERLSRTFAMIVSDPSDLLNMEGCWTISKLHAFINEAILQTSHQAVTPSELIVYLLRAVQELEGLGELLLRRYTSQSTTWNLLLALQSVKCLLNTCVHRQLFLVPWVWQSVRLYLRRVLRTLRATLLPLTAPAQSDSSSSAGGGTMVGSGVASGMAGETVGPNGTRLVIPRVLSARRSTHAHYLKPVDDVDGGEAGSVVEGVPRKELEEEAATPTLTFADVLGMVVDAFLLLRPVLVVAAARHVFPTAGGQDIAMLPTPPRRKDAKAADVDAAANSNAATPAVEDHYRVLTVAMKASTAQQTLFSSWRWWSLFATLDALALLLARYIRARRIPVVYISDAGGAQHQRRLLAGDDTEGDGEEAGAAQAAAAVADTISSAATAGGEDDGAVRRGSDVGNGALVEGLEGGSGDGGGGAAPVAPRVVTDVPSVVSRDSLRVQQAVRNMRYTFLRDPFFTMVLKQPIYDNFFKGYLNRIPLLGSLLAFQVSYFLSMQHFSFLYSTGQ